MFSCPISAVWSRWSRPRSTWWRSTPSARNLAALIEERTGRAAEIVDGPAGPHVHWSGGGEPAVLILGHHDTVFPMGALGERPFTVTDGRITGPGVFDMKAGIIQAIHAVAALDDASGVEMLFTADEEVGSGYVTRTARSPRPGLRQRARARTER